MTTKARDIITHAIDAHLGNLGGLPLGSLLAGRVLAALTDAGWELVQLPEPDYVDEPERDGVIGYGYNGGPGDKHLSERGVYAYDGEVFDQWDSVSPNDARKIGSWWYAAAAKAAGSAR